MATKKKDNKSVEDHIDNVDERKKMANLVVSQLRATFGQGSIMKMNEVMTNNVEVISTGSLAVDMATGIGGLPKGRIIEIFGPESSGKTSLTLSVMAQAQKLGGVAALIDAEHAFDPTWAAKFGVDLNELYVSQPDTGEQALEIVDHLVRSSAFDVIVIDSVAALVPKSEIEGEMGASSMGVQARLMSQALRKLTGIISKSNTVVIFINQIRLKIGVMFGNPETTTGGNALKFYASQRFDVRKIGMLKNDGEDVGIRVKVKVVKNKLAAPFKISEFDMMFDEPGVISTAGELIDLGTVFGAITKSGNTYTYTVPGEEEVKLGVGRENAKNALYQRPDLIKKAQAYSMLKFKEKLRSKGKEDKDATDGVEISNIKDETLEDFDSDDIS